MTEPVEDQEALAPRPLPREQREPWRTFLPTMFRIGINSFGGPVAQIGVMQRAAVEERKWLTQGQFVHLINFANLIPGPEALEIAIHLGWIRRGILGGIVAGLLFIWPGFVSLTALAWVYAAYGRLDAVAGFFDGVRPVAMALVASAATRLSSKSLRGGASYVLMGAAFVASYLFDVHFVAILGGAGLLGLLLGRHRAKAGPQRRLGWLFGALVLLLIGAAQFGPRARDARREYAQASLPAVARLSAPEVTAARLGEVAVVNTKAALLTFGGAYTVLPYLREQAVFEHHWLGDRQMMDALALGETTPGPLISIGVFLSYLAAGFPGAIVGCFFLFLPSFVLVLALGRFIETVERIPLARAVLWGFSAGTLGLILALAATLVPASIPDVFAGAIGAIAFVLVWRFDVNLLVAVLAGGAIGVLRTCL